MGAAVINVKFNWVARRFYQANALDESTARTLEEMGIDPSRLAYCQPVRLLKWKHILRRTEDGRYYIDMDAFNRYRRWLLGTFVLVMGLVVLCGMVAFA